jgi:membrane associated rhomboid family serine protease
VEDRFGHAKFALFYLLCGIAATFAQVAVNAGSNILNLGASGAIAGVLGAYLILFPRGQVKVLMGRGVVPMPALILIGLWIVLQFINGAGAITQSAETGGVAYMAHIGGFVAGLVLTFFLAAGGQKQQRDGLSGRFYYRVVQSSCRLIPRVSYFVLSGARLPGEALVAPEGGLVLKSLSGTAQEYPLPKN